MSLFICFVWSGGIFADWRKKKGWLDRVFWPVDLGQKLAQWAWRNDQ
jgi:hypothetical protein